MEAVRRTVVEVQPAPRRARHQRPGALPECLEGRYALGAVRHVEDDDVASAKRQLAVGVALEHAIEFSRVGGSIEKAVRSLEGFFALGYEEDLPPAADVLKGLLVERAHAGAFQRASKVSIETGRGCIWWELSGTSQPLDKVQGLRLNPSSLTRPICRLNLPALVAGFFILFPSALTVKKLVLRWLRYGHPSATSPLASPPRRGLFLALDRVDGIR